MNQRDLKVSQRLTLSLALLITLLFIVAGIAYARVTSVSGAMRSTHHEGAAKAILLKEPAHAMRTLLELTGPEARRRYEGALMKEASQAAAQQTRATRVIVLALALATGLFGLLVAWLATRGAPNRPAPAARRLMHAEAA